jgi:membrane-associated protein
MEWLRFGAVAAAAGTAWATYAGLIGYLGGRAFEDNLSLGLVVGFGLAATVFVGAEGIRRIRRRSHRTQPVSFAGCATS